MDVLVELGGKQLRVKKDMELTVSRLKDRKVGDKFELNPLCVMDEKSIMTEKGKLKNVRVLFEITGEKKGEKIYSFKKKPKTGYKRGIGYRDSLMVLKVENIIQK